ncbi:MAG: galactose-1-phosphate uridylyltransferase [Endomicrobia bacterium]|nr:galactose-1-phosphate uridylyltransferase [Endomicrobiia bacterium]MCL2506517.1 galactose-1-phosphate uridylyltransferase [Endomicrobiia bacterium]
MPEFRRDPVIGRWVIIDPARRFNKSIPSESESYPKDYSGCPFCPGNEYMTRPEILAYSKISGRTPNTKGWDLRVIPNNQPVLAIEGTLNRRGEGMYDKMEGIGAHEIIIETPEHNIKQAEITAQYYETLYNASIARIKDLRNDQRLEYILIFKNYGVLANAVFEHPHSQLIAMPIVPKRVREEIDGAKKYFSYKERCVFCDMIAQELSDAARVVDENEFFVAFCPYAARYPFETWILPKNHASDFDSISEREITSYAQITKSVFSKISKVLDDCAYSFLIHTGPLKERNIPYYHWHAEIIPKLIKTAGFEWGTGLYVNPVSPEDAAKYLREAE